MKGTNTRNSWPWGLSWPGGKRDDKGTDWLREQNEVKGQGAEDMQTYVKVGDCNFLSW